MDNTDYRSQIEVKNRTFTIFDITRLEKNGIADIKRLPYSIKILVENLLRKLDGRVVLGQDLENIARWQKKTMKRRWKFLTTRRGC